MSIMYLIGLSCKSLTSFDVLFVRLVNVAMISLSVVRRTKVNTFMGIIVLQSVLSFGEMSWSATKFTKHLLKALLSACSLRV